MTRARVHPVGTLKPADLANVCVRCGRPDPKMRQANFNPLCYSCQCTVNRAVKNLMDATGRTRDEVQAIILAIEARAGGRCELCGDDHRLVIDHDHATGEIRGVLCHRCNRSLGQLGDDPLDLAVRLLAYGSLNDGETDT